MHAERGQATVEWIGLVLLASLLLGALATAVPAVDGRSLGGLLAHRLACAARGGCEDGARALARAYGDRDARLLRRHLPGLVYEPGERQLPVDWRECRDADCAQAPDEHDLDAHRTDAGLRTTVFTHVVRRGGRRYLQYWLYYPDSNTAFAGSDAVWRHSALVRAAGGLVTGSRSYPGYHRDDWEGYAVRLDRDGDARARATSHGHWQWCKLARCEGRWGRPTGWTRVSRGSHAGHLPLDIDGPRPRPRVGPSHHRRPRTEYRAQVPGAGLHERTSTAAGIRLVPLERIDRRRYRPLDHDVVPPWHKDVYGNPESPGS